ncbi:ClpXP protease specificity-enhancing factor [Chromatiales bacterium (ex Bugula neritina AB1)]|nr:ClpXP protease specificity-enhancing factor [Chromatiales bacterium (ex Bugula neritina AB1)]
MTSSQPYLIRAIYEWIVDNNLTPYLMVDATRKGTIVPEDYLDEKGMIILNISPSATSELLMSNEEITFNARFSGQAICIVVPTYSVKAIYARENGQGMMFDGEAADEEASQAERNASKDKKRATLESVSSDGGVAPAKPDEAPSEKKTGAGGRKKGPNLKVVK